MARGTIKTPLRIRRKRVRNQGTPKVLELVAVGGVGFLATGLSATLLRWSLLHDQRSATPMETFTWSQLGLQMGTSWGGAKVLELFQPNASAEGAYKIGSYASVAVTALGLLAKSASPEVKKFLGVGHSWTGSSGPNSSTSSPPKLDQGTDQLAKKEAKLIYDDIAGRVAGFWLSESGYLPITETLIYSDKDNDQVYFLTASRELITRPKGMGPWLAIPQSTGLPSINTSGVDLSESSEEIGTKVRLVAGNSPDAGYLVDITRTTKLPYRAEEGTDNVLVKEPSNGVEYLAMSETGYPMKVQSGQVNAVSASLAPALGYGIPTSPMYAPYGRSTGWNHGWSR